MGVLPGFCSLLKDRTAIGILKVSDTWFSYLVKFVELNKSQ